MESEVAIARNGGLPHGCNTFLAIAWSGELICFQSTSALHSRQSVFGGLGLNLGLGIRVWGVGMRAQTFSTFDSLRKLPRSSSRDSNVP